jgi:hypothetical protein
MPVHLRRNVGFWTVSTAPTVITPYSAVQFAVNQNYGVRPYKTMPTVHYNLTILWPFGSNFISKLFFCLQQLFMNNTQINDQIKYCVRL